MLMNYMMLDVTSCESHLQNESTAGISCEVRVNCGCKIVAPFPFICEAITAMQGSSLGDTSVILENDRIVLRDGLGLVQVGDIGRAFNVIAFEGKINAHKAYASHCRNTRASDPIDFRCEWPRGRALVREEFSHSITGIMRDYGYVATRGSGNLLYAETIP
jgi:hypothetical protein